MNKHTVRRNILVVNFILGGVEGILVAFWILSAAWTVKTGWGGSTTRLVLMAGILAASLTLFWLAWRSRKVSARAEAFFARLENGQTRDLALRWTLALFAAGVFLSALPGYWFQAKANYWDQLHPILAWAALFFGQTLIALIAVNWTLYRSRFSTLWTGNKRLLRISGIFLVLFLILWIFIAVTRIGINPDIAAWNNAGVPILGLQILAALALSLLAEYGLQRWEQAGQPTARSSSRTFPFVDLLLCLALWGLAVGMWLAEPMPRSFNAPRPSPPNYEFYPFSDSIVYDAGGQFALIGEGINNHAPTDKPFYMLFLGILHLMGGQSYTTVIVLQVCVLALFPIILYLFGKAMQSRGVGILLALLSIFKERNAIAAALDIQVSHVKLMLTESATALAVLLFAFLLFRWAGKEDRPNTLLLWAGGILGVAGLIRLNPLVLIPFAILIVLLRYGRNWKHSVVPLLIMGLGFVLVVGPWVITGRDAKGRNFYWIKIESVLKRYQRGLPDDNETAPASFNNQAGIKLAALSQPPNDLTALTGETLYSKAAGGMTALEFIPAHFFHNQITGMFILPLTWTLEDLPHATSSPLRARDWNGVFSFENDILLLANLCLIALGLSMAWRRWRFAGLTPAFIEFGYFLSNALARTSGSRYLIPGDWAIYFYYGVGLFQTGMWILSATGLSIGAAASRQIGKEKPKQRLLWSVPIVVLLAVGSLLPLANDAIPARYPPSTKEEAFDTIKTKFPLSELGLSGLLSREKRNEAFLKNGKSVVFQARALYPRYLLKDTGLCKRCYILDVAFGVRDFSRLAFVAIGPYSAGVVLRMDEIPADIRDAGFANGADVWVIGCTTRVRKFTTRMGVNIPIVQAIAVLITDSNGTRAYSQPDANLRCK